MQTAILLLGCQRRGVLHAKNLIQWLTRRDIILREPALSVEWATIFMLAPVRAFSRVYFNRTCQESILSNIWVAGNCFSKYTTRQLDERLGSVARVSICS